MADNIDDIVEWQMSLDRDKEMSAARASAHRCPNCHREWHGILKPGCGGSHLSKPAAETSGLPEPELDTPDMLARLFGL